MSAEYWTDFCRRQNEAARENFFGNLQTLRKAVAVGDPHAMQLQRFGMDLEKRQPYDFRVAIAQIEAQIDALVSSGTLGADQVLRPAKAFRCGAHDCDVLFVAFGQPVPADAQPLNLLAPSVFVDMLSAGYFPIGEPIREATNQTLAEHDLAHLCGFLSNPEYMRCVREAFARVGNKLRRGDATSARLAAALQHFDSLYSLRLYYLVEVFAEVRPDQRARLQALLGAALPLALDVAQIRPAVLAELRRRAADPAELYAWLDALYAAFPALVNPLGGESRDILNRRRKFQRTAALGGSPYDRYSKFSSKFDGNSIYSLYQNACAALEHVRSNHANFAASLELVHAPLIGALIGTAQLSVGDWVLQAVEEQPDPSSKLWRYLNLSGFWEPSDLLRLCHSHANFDAVLGAFGDLDALAADL